MCHNFAPPCEPLYLPLCMPQMTLLWTNKVHKFDVSISIEVNLLGRHALALRRLVQAEFVSQVTASFSLH